MADTAFPVGVEGRGWTKPARDALVAMLGLVVVIAVMFAGYASAFGKPEPHDIPIAVVGPATAVTRLGESPALATRTAPDDAAVRTLVADRRVYGGLDLTTAGEIHLYVAGGASRSVATALTAIADRLGQQEKAAVHVTDLAPTARQDPNGTIEFYCVVFLAVGAALGATVLGRVLGSVRSLPHLSRRLLGLVVYSALLALTVTVLADLVYGGLVGHFGLLFLALTAYTLTIAIAATGVAALLGSVAGLVLTLGLTIFGNTSAGGAVGRPLESPLFRAIEPYLPHGAGMSIVRGVQYFGGRGISTGVLTLVVWTAVGTGLFVAYAVRAGRAAG